MAGRVLIVNSRLLSKLWYLAYFVSFPPWFFKVLSRIVSTFLWDSKHPQISLSSIQIPLKAGGLGLIKPEYQVIAMKGWWIKCMAQLTGPAWVSLALHNFKIRYSPVGSSFEVFGSGVHVAALRHKGLW